MEKLSASLLWDQGPVASSTLVLIVTIVVLFIGERWWSMNKLQRLGYSGPPRNLIFGNLKEFTEINANFQDGWKNLIEKYGSRVGNVEGKSMAMYQGRIPTIVVTDPEVIKFIAIRNFNNFRNRPFSSLRRSTNLLSLRDDRWRSVRHTLTPTFSQAKMKLMSKTISNIVSITMDIIDDHVKENKPVDFYRLYHGLTLEVIGKCALAVNVDSQRNPEHQILKSAKAFFSNSVKTNSFARVVMCLIPSLVKWIPQIARLDQLASNNPIRIIRKQVQEVIEIRKSSDTKTVDALQLMMEAAHLVNSRDVEDESVRKQPYNIESVSNNKVKKMSEEEVADNAIVFLLAGYETTSTMLSYTSYLLAKHQDVQQRLYEEIDQVLEGKDEVTFDLICQMEYLDMVANESLRFYPPISSVITREIDEDCDYGGLKFPAGCVVGFPISYMHYNEKLWPNPKTFDPERFHPSKKKDIHVSSFLPFGLGPRHCIGMRFALMEAKLALVRLLQKYHIQPCELTEEDIKTKEGNISLTPISGHIYLSCTPRH